MDIKISKDKHIGELVDRENLIYVRWNKIKNCAITTKKVIDKGKTSKTLSKEKLIKNTNKNLQSFLEISTVQTEALPSHKLQDYAYE